MNLYAPIAKLNRLSDWIEDNWLPSWLTYNRVGDPVSWFFSHPMWVLVGAKLGALAGWFLWDWRHGAVAGAWFVVGVYVSIREPLAAWDGYRTWGWPGAWQRLVRNPYCSGVQVGWLADGIGDVVGPALLAWLLMAWLL